MRQSELFVKTRKHAPKEEVSKNAQLLIRAGYIDKLHSGVYTYLPLGLRVLEKIKTIIREEMNKANGQEIYMPSLQPKENWQITGRLEIEKPYIALDQTKREYVLGPTHEEVVVPLVKQFVSSYKDLPKAVYQIQTKFRNELRSKSGLLRGREFPMKDLYSFHRSEEDLKVYYERMRLAYQEIFRRVGIGERTYYTFAAGGSFSKYSHEFQTLTSAGEDIIYICNDCQLAINKEIIADQPMCPGCGHKPDREEKSVEVGNIFELKTKYTEPFKMTYKDEKGKLQPVIMGCYGIGVSRLMGTIVEVYGDEKGLVWPESVAPFRVHLIALAGKNEEVRQQAEAAYYALQEKGVEVLYDDRDISAGEKLNDADLIGTPFRVVISDKGHSAGTVEVMDRRLGDVKNVKRDHLIEHFTG